MTKTFTTVLVLQCPDAGLLDLDDPIGRHLDVPAHGELTIRRLLSHTAGMQREPFGDVWDTLNPPALSGLLDDLARTEAIHPSARRFHYSNLGFALLGHAAATRLGGDWAELVADRICRPLGLTGTTAAAILELPHLLLEEALAADPVRVQPWTPGAAAPPELRSVLGRWWGEGFEYVFRWSGGLLTARGVDDPSSAPPAVFAALPGQPDVLRTVSGREVGELLRLTRDGTGEVTRMHWATYRFTRRQETFDGGWVSRPAC